MISDLSGQRITPSEKAEREAAINHASDLFIAGVERMHIAAAKKECGLCAYKAAGKGVWKCTHDAHFPCPNGLSWGRKQDPNFVCNGFLQKHTAPPIPLQLKKKGLPVPEGVKFIYIGAPRGKTKKGVPQHKGVVTVSWAETTPGRLRMAFSFCSPGQKGVPPDGKGYLGRPNIPLDPWCKADGRNSAVDRLYEHSLVIPFLYDAKRTVHETVRAVLSHDFGRLAALSPGATMWEWVPSWTRELGKELMKQRRYDLTHAADALHYLLPPKIHFISTPRRLEPFGSYFIDEAAPIFPEAMAFLDKIVSRRMRSAPPTLEQVMARMAFDIFTLDPQK